MALRIGVLGVADIVPKSIIAAARGRSDVTVAAIASRDVARARAFIDGLGVEADAETYEGLLARDDVDLVHVATPPSLHCDWTIRALGAGKAVLCEKPFAMDAAEAGRMVAAARSAGRPLIEAFHYRFHPETVRVFDMVLGGDLGPLLRLEASFEIPLPRDRSAWRWQAPMGGGALMDLGCYAVHACRSLCRDEPVSVLADVIVESGVDAKTKAKLEFPGGVSADVSASFIAEGVSAGLRVVGEKGWLEFDKYVAPQIGFRLSGSIDGKGGFERSGAGATSFAAQMDHVVEVIAGRTHPLTGGDDAVRNMAAIDLIRRAAASGVRSQARDETYERRPS